MLMIKPIITKMQHLTRLQIASKSIFCFIELEPNHSAGACLRDDNEFCTQTFFQLNWRYYDKVDYFIKHEKIFSVKWFSYMPKSSKFVGLQLHIPTQ